MEFKRAIKEKLAHHLMLLLIFLSGLLLFGMVFALYWRSRPILLLKPLSELLLGSAWAPSRGEFGFFPFIIGTLWVTLVAILIAVPLCLLSSIYLSEFAGARVREWSKPPIDLLAGIPSVVYGVWGVLVVVPLVKDRIAPFFGSFSTGYCVLTAGIVLAIMVFPVIIHISVEVMGYVPLELREASLALGATRWQTVKYVILRKSLPGLIAGVVLGLSRAFGETMAVLMVAGNVPRVPKSVFQPVYTLPALIANNYGEMLSVPLYDSALLFASFLLLVVVLVFNIISRIFLIRIERRIQ